MNESMGIYVVIGFVLLSIFIMYNMIITRMNRAKRAWSDVITYEKLKHDVLPELHKLTEDFKEFETEFVERITKLREAVSGLNNNVIDVNALKETEELSKNVFSSLKATAENYPELESANIVRDLMAQVAEKNENVAAAITIYNRGVEQFNNSIEMVPLNIVNAIFVNKSKLTCFHQSNTVESYDYKPDFS
ncbi:MULTISPECIES: LemA family protein [unclassified Pseudoalteromonas]|uniref:LemA family protein n=1 Tax=unclassified Pseudoalteromonas TaxID=194690 RepID=UPI000695006E|nr:MULTISPECIES: LemA family protein [unclassified Pseudoalteromonas]